ncbi:hypothetical protein [Brevibacillus sp. MS2.2]|uniref:hypothetical protein n=1 Tax=Brevibacillus sp. MS2.2 TaxID=2738981 RepID=UPI00156AB258|nr:hypothetical protein [Brevibacillus sp. MS2.2]NRR20086.1 hypothetical protein [Brevibacillus sp. MS2.2]
MKRFSAITMTIFALLTLHSSTAFAGYGDQQNESEPNNSSAQATVIEEGTEVYGQIDRYDESDYFKITFNHYGPIRIMLSDSQTYPQNYNLYVYDDKLLLVGKSEQPWDGYEDEVYIPNVNGFKPYYIEVRKGAESKWSNGKYRLQAGW